MSTRSNRFFTDETEGIKVISRNVMAHLNINAIDKESMTEVPVSWEMFIEGSNDEFFYSLICFCDKICHVFFALNSLFSTECLTDHLQQNSKRCKVVNLNFV